MVPEDEWYKYNIWKSMASLAYEHFELYLPDKELHSNTFLDQLKKWDVFTTSILKDGRGSVSNELINQDKVLEKIQVKIRGIMGPLFQIWDILEKATNSNEQSVNASLEDMQKSYGTNRVDGGSKFKYCDLP